jgi:hypothetical protein
VLCLSVCRNANVAYREHAYSIDNVSLNIKSEMGQEGAKSYLRDYVFTPLYKPAKIAYKQSRARFDRPAQSAPSERTLQHSE